MRTEGRRFEFVQAAVLLHRLFARGPRDRPFRYGGDPGLEFPSAQAELVALPTDERPGHLRVSFLGVAGLMGPLPSHYTELIEARRRGGDAALADFWALFEDRAVSLFLGAHLRTRYWHRFAWLGGETTVAPDVRSHPFQEAILSLAGTATADIRERAGLPPFAQLFYGGLLAQQPRSADSLRRVLEGYFRVPAEVESMTGAWVPLPSGSLSRLGTPLARLGERFVLGDRVFAPGLRFRVRLGPLSRERLDSLLPGTRGGAELTRFLRFAVGPQLQFDYTLRLRRRETPEPRLGGTTRLGWNCWMHCGEVDRDPEAGPFSPDPMERAPAGAGGTQWQT